MLFLAGLLGLLAVGSIVVVMAIKEDLVDEDTPPTEDEIDQSIDSADGPPPSLDEDDIVTGSDGDDQINGLGGDDIVEGATGDEELRSGSGEDQNLDGEGDNVVHAEGGDVLLGIQEVPKPDDTIDPPSGDYVNGGVDNDTVLTGQCNAVTTGEGTDSIVVGDWISQSHSATVMDYDTNEDSLVLVWDDVSDPEPEIDVIEDKENPDLAHVMLNGRVLADINGGSGLTPSDIILVPQSAALSAAAHPTIAALFKAA